MQEYDFEVVYNAGLKILDADGLSHNLSPLLEDLTGARWRCISDKETVPSWHAYLAWMEGKSSQVDKEALENVVADNLNEKGSRMSTDVKKDQGILHRLQLGEFLPYTTFQKQDLIAYKVATFH